MPFSNFRLSGVKFSIKVKSVFPAYTTNVNPVTMIVSCSIYQTRDINVALLILILMLFQNSTFTSSLDTHKWEKADE